MLVPKVYVDAYANLRSWLMVDGSWIYTNTPIINYLQNTGKQATNAQNELSNFRTRLKAAAKNPNIAYAKTFNFEEYDYINPSITRTFIGKATPWEIQETIQLGSLIGVINSENVRTYCLKWLGIDCGGFVAAYWGIGVPHMVNPSPPGATGISPRSFWNDGKSRRRMSTPEAGDAAIFFKDVKNNNPDIQKQRDSSNNFIKDTGSEAFHIGLVNNIGTSGDAITMLEIAESSGASSTYGGNGVNVHQVSVTATGKSGPYIYAELGNKDRIYFVAPPAGAGPEMPYSYGET